MGTVIVIVLLVIAAGCGLLVYWPEMHGMPEQKAVAQQQRLSHKAASRAKAQAQQQALVCPHCQTRGFVAIRRVQRAKRKTATRIAGGVMTGGGSLLATGVSKKRWVRAMSCSNCGMNWDVAEQG